MGLVRNLIVLENAIFVVSASALLFHLDFILALREERQQVRVGQKDILDEQLIAKTANIILVIRWFLLPTTTLSLPIVLRIIID